ncbi:MAG: efflux transporter outer membrane subunit [Kofleriaceae bacterium]
MLAVRRTLGARARALALAAVAAWSCTPGPRYHVPPTLVPSARTYHELPGSWKLARPADAIPRGRWWTMFREPELDALQARLAIHNQSIAQAIHNYQAARAEIRAARAQYFPTLSVGPSASSSRSGAISDDFGVRTTIYSLPADVSWAPDLFGRVRSTVRQRQYGAQQSAADLESTRLLAQAQLAELYFQIRGQDALQELLDATVASNVEVVELTRSRYRNGLENESAVVQAELTLQTARVQATNAALLRAQFEHAIATLLGVPATGFRMPRRALLASPPVIPTGAPSQLLERRPDIASAERAMARANAEIGAGYAAYYPVITLTGMAGFAASELASLLTWPARTWSFAATLAETVFDGGARRAAVDQAIATYHAAVASYRQTVLAAFQQVEDFLARVRVLEVEIAQQRTAVALAERAFELERQRYQAGLDPYIQLMLQQNALLAARQALVTLQVQHITAAVTLVQALGGGWDRSALPTPAEVSAKPGRSGPERRRTAPDR